MSRTVAYLTSLYARAGDTFIRREVEELRRLGWTVHTFSVRRPDEDEDVSEEILRERRSTDYILRRGAAPLVASFLRLALRHPRRVLGAISLAGRVRAPGVKSWLWHWIYLLEAAYLAERMSRSGAVLLHDHIAMASGTVAMLASVLAAVPFSMTVHGSELLAAEQWGLGTKIARSSATVCISSYGIAQCMMHAPPAEWHKLQLIRCGVDGTFLEADSRPAPASRRLVSVGRLSPEKGQILLVEAAALLRSQGVEFELVLVGDGPSRPEVERRIREAHLSGSIRLVGWQGSTAVRDWISDSRALVLPSFNEGIPVVLMEAMALRRPVIATHVGGIPELVQPGSTGWLVPAGSVVDLAMAMREVLAAPSDLLAEIGERGRRRVLELHDLSGEVRKLAELFRRIVAGR